MPTYAYVCKQCGHRFDAVQSFADPTLTECDVCGGPLRKEYGSIGVTFNGSGFYRTDSRPAETSGSSDAGASSPSSGSTGGDSAASSASSKSEAKTSPASTGT